VHNQSRDLGDRCGAERKERQKARTRESTRKKDSQEDGGELSTDCGNVLGLSIRLASRSFLGLSTGQPLTAVLGTSEGFLGHTVMVYLIMQG
jgi:hypothetical protein